MPPPVTNSQRTTFEIIPDPRPKFDGFLAEILLKAWHSDQDTSRA
jgi:hypothetical protein